jgi:hypothetical protein
MESLFATVLFLAVIGFLVHLIVTYVPLFAPFKDVIVAVVVVVLVVWLAAVFFDHAPLPTLPRFRR